MSQVISSRDFDGFRGGRRGFGGGDRGRGGGGGFPVGDHDSSRGFGGGGDRRSSKGGFGGDCSTARGFGEGNKGGFPGGRGGGGRRDRGGRTNQAEKEPVFREIQDGLQLLVVYKTVPTSEETKQQLPNFHSRTTRPTGKDFSTGSTSTAHVLLFTDLESLETAKVKLDKDPNVETTDYMGMRSAKKQAEATENRQLFMKFVGSPDEDSVKKLDSRIQSVEFLKSTTESTTKAWESATEPLKSTTLLALFPSLEAATSAIKSLTSKIGANGLSYVRESFGMKYQTAALAGTQRNQVVLRDVPKTTTLKDLAELFPDAASFNLYVKTFTASPYCHASLRFKENKRAAEILVKKEIKILGKRVYVVAAHSSLLKDFLELGQITNDNKTKAAEDMVRAPMRMTTKKVTKRERKKRERKNRMAKEGAENKLRDNEEISGCYK